MAMWAVLQVGRNGRIIDVSDDNGKRVKERKRSVLERLPLVLASAF